MPLSAGTKIGPYEILSLLGAGGMGEVYLAEDSRLKRKVALKILPAQLQNDPSRLQRFKREATSAATLNHPNICTIYEVGEANGSAFISMEYVEGTTLRDLIPSDGMPVAQVLEIGIQIVDALDEARKKNIVHRDIKPSNIILTSRNQVKILDFGLAKFLQKSEGTEDESTISHLTQTGIVVGTVAYMSPEQALGKSVDHRSDIFSCGTLFYEMLTSRLPFTGQSTTQVIDGILHKQPPAVTDHKKNVPELLLHILSKMLQKDPKDRYQSAHEIWTDLRQLKDGSTLSAPVIAKGIGKKMALILGAAILIPLLIIAFQFFNKPSSGSVGQIASMVALPCKVYGKPELGYLTDAVPSTLSTHLASIEGLETKMPPTSVEVEKLHGDLDKISNAYNVNAFVVSSIMTEANRFVLNVQLVNTADKRVLWSKEYEGKREEYIDLTRQAADGIRQAVRPSAGSVQNAAALPSTSEAELAFREGLHYSYRYNNLRKIPDFEKSLAAFQRALNIDPKLADAAAEISWLYIFRWESEPSTTFLNQVNFWGTRALKINPKCGKAYASLTVGELYSKTKPDLGKCFEYIFKGLSYSPNDPYNHLALGFVLDLSATFVSISAYKESHRLDPLYFYAPLNASEKLYFLGDYEESLRWAEKDLDIEPDAPFGVLTKIGPLIELNKLKEAQELLKQVDNFEAEGKLRPSIVRPLHHNLAWQMNNFSLATKLFDDIFQDPQSFGYQFNAGHYIVPNLMRHGQKDRAIKILTRDLEFNFVPMYDFLMLNPYLEELRKDAGAKEIIARSKTQFDEMLIHVKKAHNENLLPKYIELRFADLLQKLGYPSL
jgi:eukaryotic-like serine/threonine-protein kinase